eukprot:GILJ01004411.1.p1 GENE.GILJ01004411.1~~GILJ01004411.1.p1  ORF type:complete len:2283 (+),score=370.59 GILJ01004411.1:173-7021(+)
MVTFAHSIFWQVRHLIAGLKKSNFKPSLTELHHLIQQYPYDAQLYLLKTLFEQIDFRDPKVLNGQKDQLKVLVLSQEISSLVTQPTFATLICQAFETISSKQLEEFLVDFCKTLKLSVVHQIIIGTALAQSPLAEVRHTGLKLVQARMDDYKKEKFPDNALHALLYLLRSSVSFNEGEEPLLRDRERWIRSLFEAHPEKDLNLSFAPMVSSDIRFHNANRMGAELTFEALAQEMTTGIRPVDMMEDLGHHCCATPAALREVFSQFSDITEKDIAMILGMMARTHQPSDDATSAMLQSAFSALQDHGRHGLMNAPAADAASRGLTWNIDVFVTTVNEMFPNFRWQAVIAALDYPGFLVVDAKGFFIIVSAYRKATSEPFPFAAIFRRWVNTTGQVSFLKFAIAAPADVLSFAECGRRQNSVESIPNVKHPYGSANQAWCSLDLIECLLMLSECEGQYPVVRSIFEYPLKNCPELLVLGLVQVQQLVRNPLQHELYSLLLPGIFMPQTATPTNASGPMLVAIWQANPFFFVKQLEDMYHKQPSAIARVFDITQDVKESLLRVLSSDFYAFALDLAAVAFANQCLHIEKWLQERIESEGEPFIRACLDFIATKALSVSSDKGDRQPPPGLSLEAIALFFQALTQKDLAATMNADLSKQVLELHAAVCKTYPQLLIPTANNEKIEQEANNFMHKIYIGELSIANLIEQMKAFKASEKPNEYDIYNCIVHNLFDEYRFFHKYPDKELKITAEFFGALIQHQLVSNLTLGIGLSYVLDALRRPAGSKMFRFGMYALEQFKTRLMEWPQFSLHVTQMEHVRQQQPELVDYLQKMLIQSGADLTKTETEVTAATLTSSHVPGTAPSQPASDLPRKEAEAPAASPEQPRVRSEKEKDIPTPSVTGGPAFPTVSIESLSAEMMASVVAPSETLSDQVFFIVNNLSTANMDVKVGEFKQVLNDEILDWFAYYLVFKRISTEANFHSLYIEFLEKVGSSRLENRVLHHVVTAIDKLVHSDKVKHTPNLASTERSWIKNLGSFLGNFTLARNRPVLYDSIDPKSYLLWGYEYGVLVAVMPLVCKILECTKHSKIFKPANPWVAPILALVVEIYNLPDLKTTLKFEVEILFKNLVLDVSSIKPSSLLVGLSRKGPDTDFRRSENKTAFPEPVPAVLETDISRPAAAPSPAPISTLPKDVEVEAGVVNAAVSGPVYTSPLTASSSTPAVYPQGFNEQTVIPNLASYVVINPNLTLFNQQPRLKAIVPLAVDRAIREIISPVVERSVTIACITTRELVLKDFALEGDENRLRKAAHLMVQNLAGSLSLVTCKEPLRVSLSNNLRTLLQQTTSDAAAIEQVVQYASTENLDLGCALIEKAVTEKAMRDVDESIANAVKARIKHREQTGQPYYDMTIFNNGRYPSNLPDSLRPKPGVLGPQQLRVYEDFARLPRAQPLVVPRAAGVSTQPGQAPFAQGGAFPDLESAGYKAAAVPSASAAAYAQAQQPAAVAGGASVRRTTTPGLPSLSSAMQGGSEAATPETLSVQQALEKFNQCVSKLDQAISRLPPNTPLATLPPDSDIHQWLRFVPALVSQSVSRDESGMAFAQKVFKRLYDDNNRLRIEVYMAILEGIREVYKKVVKELTSWLNYSDDERKLHKDITIGFIRSQLINVADFDTMLSKMIDTGRGTAPMEFAIHLVKTLVLEEHNVTPAELFNVLDSMNKFSQRNKVLPDGLTRLLEDVRTLSLGGPRDDKGRLKDKKSGKDKAAEKAVKEPQEPAGVREHVAALLDEGIRIFNQPNANDKGYANYLSVLQQQGVLKGDENLDRFFRIITEISVERALASLSFTPKSAGGSVMNTQAIDAFSRLVHLLVKYSDPNAQTKVNILLKALNAIVKVLMKDYDSNKKTFNQRPYFRLLVNLLVDLNQPDPVLEQCNYQLLTAFSNTFHTLQPARVQGFIFAWLELISHRMFMPKLLLVKGQKGWPMFQRLLVALFKFLEPHLRSSDMGESIRLLYKGTLRVLLVLLHDFPEFLCDFHFSFCDVLPTSCVQMRNLILSAFPRNMRLPDPFTPNLKVDLLPEIAQSPRILANFTTSLSYMNIKADIDQYLKMRQKVVLSDLRNKLLLAPKDITSAGTRYNVPVINALVLYVGSQAIVQLQSNKASQPITHNASMEIFQALGTELDREGRYLFLNAIANQLRYPNNHTHYFSCVLLFLFAEAREEIVQEQITRVLLERLIVHRPHPWGLLITFIELIKNPRYSFWNHTFTKCAPEIEKLFDSVSRTCLGNSHPAAGQEGVAAE